MKRDRKGKGKARAAQLNPLAGGSEQSLGSVEGTKAKRTRQKSGGLGGAPGGGGGGGARGAAGNKDADLWETDIVNQWNKGMSCLSFVLHPKQIRAIRRTLDKVVELSPRQ